MSVVSYSGCLLLCVLCRPEFKPRVVASRWELAVFLGQLTSDAMTHFFQREYGNLACGEGAPSRLPTPPPLPPMTCQIILARCSCPPYPINLLCVNSDPAKREGPFGPSLTLTLTLTQGTRRSLPSRQKKLHTKKRDHLVLGPKNRTPLQNAKYNTNSSHVCSPHTNLEV